MTDRTLRTRTRDAFRLTAMCIAILAKPLAQTGLLGDAFVAVAGAIRTGPAILCFAGVALYVIYGMMLTIAVAVILTTGLARLLFAFANRRTF